MVICRTARYARYTCHAIIFRYADADDFRLMLMLLHSRRYVCHAMMPAAIVIITFSLISLTPHTVYAAIIAAAPLFLLLRHAAIDAAMLTHCRLRRAMLRCYAGHVTTMLSLLMPRSDADDAVRR